MVTHNVFATIALAESINHVLIGQLLDIYADESDGIVYKYGY